MRRFNILATLAMASLLPLAPSSLSAQNTQEVANGSAAITINGALLTYFENADVGITADTPATYANGVAHFNIPTGGVDQDTLVGAVYMSGGLTFTGSSTTVILSQLAIVSDPGVGPQMYSLITVNGTCQGIFQLFDISGAVSSPYTGNSITLSNLNLTLSSGGAAELNKAFGGQNFTQGEAIGTMTLNLTTAAYATTETQRTR